MILGGTESTDHIALLCFNLGYLLLVYVHFDVSAIVARLVFCSPWGCKDSGALLDCWIRTLHRNIVSGVLGLHCCQFAPILGAANLAWRVQKTTVVCSKYISVRVNLCFGSQSLLS